MNKKSIIKYIASLIAVAFVVMVWFGTKQAAGAVQRLEEIEAYYVGQEVEVGKEIKLSDIQISAKYYISSGLSGAQDGYYEYEEIKKGFTITPSVIKNQGENQVVVTYQNKKCVVTVYGKVVESITADYTGDELYVGTTVPVGKIDVYAYFSDGTFEKVRDFTLSEKTVTKTGSNIITVIYKGKATEVFVYGKAPLAVEELMADYVGDSIIEGNVISKSNIEVWAYYNDGSMKKITNFNISPKIAKFEGENDITVSYGGVETVIQVYAEERYIEKMNARYTGPGVIVGKKVPKEEIEVIVTYNDGFEESIDDFQMYSDEIWFEGENIVLVYYEDFFEEIMVYGVAGFAANYDNALSDYFTSPNGLDDTEVTLGMPIGVEENSFILREADPEMVEYVVQRVVYTEQFIGFDVLYEDDEMVLGFPMAMKVTVPDSFEPEKFGLYYTPNKATIMAKVNGEFLDEEQTEYQFVVYEPGTYILVNEISNRLVETIVVETKLELKENRSFSLNPQVLPLNAENKNLTYRSSDEDVATVSDNGKIRTISEGTCEIWIEAEDGSGVYTIVTVKVGNGKKRK